MPIEWILVIFFVFVTFVFIAIAVAFPEWVGITGKKNQAYYEQTEQDGKFLTETQAREAEEAAKKASEEPPR